MPILYNFLYDIGIYFSISRINSSVDNIDVLRITLCYNYTMMVTSKSPKTVALAAYQAAKQSIPPHRRTKSPKKFTQHQLAACLALKEFFKTDYRGIVGILTDSSDLKKLLELPEVPHYTTLQKAAKRLTNRGPKG